MKSIRKLAESLAPRLELPMAILGFVYLGIYALQVSNSFDKVTSYNLEIASWIVWSLFAIDLILKIVGTESFGKFFKSYWLELIALTVPFLRVLRVLRVLVAIRGLKPFMSSRMSATGTYLVLLLPLTWFIGGVAVLDAENASQSAHIQNLPDALWWSLATITTVGYGDLYPITGEGKAVAGVLMILGIALFSACAGILASWIMSDKKNEA